MPGRNPSGSAEETKLVLDLAGDALEEWIGKDELILDIYLPPENKLNPSAFFLGWQTSLTDGLGWTGLLPNLMQLQAGTG